MPDKIDSKRAEYLMRQLRGKIRAGVGGTYKHFIPEVLDEEHENDLTSRVAYACHMRKRIAAELKGEEKHSVPLPRS